LKNELVFQTCFSIYTDMMKQEIQKIIPFTISGSVLFRFQTLFLFILSLTVFSCGNPPSDDTGAPKPEYTEEDPGRWESIAEDHLPEISILGGYFSPRIKISLESKNWNKSHYIEKIGIFRISDKKDLAIQEFSPGTFVYSAEFPYEYEDDQVKVFVKCNLHDLWTVDDLKRFRE